MTGFSAPLSPYTSSLPKVLVIICYVRHTDDRKGYLFAWATSLNSPFGALHPCFPCSPTKFIDLFVLVLVASATVLLCSAEDEATDSRFSF